MRNVSFAALVLILAGAPLLAQAPGQIQPPSATGENPKPDLPNYVEVTPSIGTGGQPTDAGLRLLAERGYKSVINLRTSQEKVDLAAEEKNARELGLKYYSVPVVGANPEEKQALEFMKVLEEQQGGKVFVHCATGNRVGAFMMIYRTLRDGLSLEKAEEEARRIGLRSDALLNFARQFIARRTNPQ